MHRIAILTTANQALFELGCAVELFALARPEFDNWYKTDVISLSGKKHQATAGVIIEVQQKNDLSEYDTLIVPSWDTQTDDPTLATMIFDFHQKGGRVFSFCSGAYLLASSGLLDEKPATTHWRYAEHFKARFPCIKFQDNVLYVHEGNYGCSAGSAAAIDLGIAIIREDFGYEAANQVARRLVLAAHRDGGQAQYCDSAPIQKNQFFSDMLHWVADNLQQTIEIDEMAARTAMSRRTFDRKFRATMGMSAKTWLIKRRLDTARQLLESSEYSIEQIAELSGFANGNALRHNFRKHLRLSPSKIREQFSQSRTLKPESPK